MSENLKKNIFIVAIVVVGIGLGVLANHFFPCKNYMTPLFIVLAIYIYLEHMFAEERKKRISNLFVG